MRKNYTFKSYKNGRVNVRVSTHPVRRFLRRLRLIKFSDASKKVYLRVSYGNHKDNFGEKSLFWNDGYYQNAKDLMLAFYAFDEMKPEDFE